VWEIFRPDGLSVWRDKRYLDRFPHYWRLLHNQAVAMYKIAKTVPILDLSPDMPRSELEHLHEAGRKVFKEKLREKLSLEEFERKPILAGPNFLDLKVQLAYEYLKECVFCENQCKVDRTRGKVGTCGVSNHATLASAFEHMGEESILVPSGTIFFNGCTFHCVFCQNWDISQEWPKDDPKRLHKVDAEQLAAIVNRLFTAEVKNINYVGGDPTSNLHVILETLKYLNVNLCQLWNSNFYNSLKAMNLLLDVMDLWMPDFKYGNNDCARKYSKIENYIEVLQRNLKLAHDEGSGEIIIRHLVLPNHVECCSKPVLEWVAKNVPKAVVNIMAQYRPEYKATKYPEIARRPSGEEMREVRSYASDLGIVWEHL
jgi:putative pyruvate formate lyase activating enzyme